MLFFIYGETWPRCLSLCSSRTQGIVSETISLVPFGYQWTSTTSMYKIKPIWTLFVVDKCFFSLFSGDQFLSGF